MNHQYVDNNDKNVIHTRNQPGIEPHPHGTEIEAMEGYLDLYRATGKHYYLRAVQNFYDLYKQDWQYPGGGIAMCEAERAFPKCYWLSSDKHYNELCCSSFWLLLNQRFHRLFPEVESYVGEMESSIYNVGIANQNSDRNITYFALLDQRKINYDSLVHCCCGVGTKMYGSLPEYIFSTAPNTLSVDLFAASFFEWERNERYTRHAYEFGPLLMAVKGPLDENSHLVLHGEAEAWPLILMQSEQPRHFTVPGQPEFEVIPYLEIKPDMEFTCFPLFHQA